MGCPHNRRYEGSSTIGSYEAVVGREEIGRRAEAARRCFIDEWMKQSIDGLMDG
jgi:hypothetical protein